MVWYKQWKEEYTHYLELLLLLLLLLLLSFGSLGRDIWLAVLDL